MKRTAVRVLFLASAGFVAVGFGNQLLSLFPARFGSPEWEVAFFGQFSANLALPMIGVMGLAGLAVSAGRRGLAMVMAAVLVLVGVVAAFGVMLVGLDFPVVWNLTAGSDAMPAVGYRLVTVKALVLCGLYAMFGVTLAWRTVRSLS